VIANMHIYFQPTSLFNTMVMLILLVGGLALIARSVRDHGASTPSKREAASQDFLDKVLQRAFPIFLGFQPVGVTGT